MGLPWLSAWAMSGANLDSSAFEAANLALLFSRHLQAPASFKSSLHQKPATS